MEEVIEVGLKRITCDECKRKVIIDTRDLDEDADLLLCPYCGTPIELSHVE